MMTGRADDLTGKLTAHADADVSRLRKPYVIED